MKFFIPTYNRYDTISTHKIFPKAKIIVHNKEQYDLYRSNPSIRKKNLIISNAKTDQFGLTRQREFVTENLVEKDEWFVFADDNIKNISCVSDEYYNTEKIDFERIKDNKYWSSVFSNECCVDIFIEKCKEMIEISEKNNVRMCSFATTPNFYFRAKKYRFVGYCIGKLILIKNDQLTWDHTITMEDFRNTADHLLRFGVVLINNFIHPISGHYEKGGMGIYDERVEHRLKDVKKLMNTYPGLFCIKKRKGFVDGTDLRMRFHSRKQIENWRNNFKSNIVIKEKKKKQKFYSSPRWSSEAVDCALPLTFDQYSNCFYSCVYCFSQYQRMLIKGKGREDYINKIANYVNVEAVKRIFRNKTKTQYSEFIKNKKALQWGGLSDPFCNFEKKYGIGLELIDFFRNELDYQISFSTKSFWWSEDERYINFFKNNKNFHVKFTLITTNEKKAAFLEKRAPSPKKRLKAIENIAKLNPGGITLRLRPYIYGVSDNHKELISRAVDSGIDSVSLEFFCFDYRITKENYKILCDISGYDIANFYKTFTSNKGSPLRLNRNIKRDVVEDIRQLCESKNIKLFVSDCHFKEKSYHSCCCGVPENFNFCKGHFCNAVLLCKDNKRVGWDDISCEMVHFENVKYALFNEKCETRAMYHGFTIKDFLHFLWNNPDHSLSPYKIFEGIMTPESLDENGNIVYKYNKKRE